MVLRVAEGSNGRIGEGELGYDGVGAWVAWA